jgi:hypothetical protein
LLKIKRRKKPRIKKRLEIKRRHSYIKVPPIGESAYMAGRLVTLGRGVCKTPECLQAVYSSETKYCYFCDKIKKGLMDVKAVY